MATGTKDSTPATGVDVTDASGGKKKRNASRRVRRELNEVTSYNCDKKGHYADKCPDKEPKN